MTLEQIFFASQIAAAIGIIGSLLFVGIQVRDGAKATRSATAQAVQDNYARWYLALGGNSDTTAVFLKGCTDMGSLTPQEKAIFVCVCMAFTSYTQNAYHQWNQGHLADELWASWEALMINLVGTPGGAAFWADRSYVFGGDFGTEVRALMAREPHPSAKGLGVVPLKHPAPVAQAGKGTPG
jgi:hypothetical protein